MSTEEQERLVACATPHLRNIITFAALTGLRSGDVFGLKWVDVDLDSGICRVFVSKTKQRKVMPLADAAVGLLKGMVRDSEYIFTYKGKPIKSIKTSFAKAKRKAGLADRPGLTPHSCRHIFVTRMWEAGGGRRHDKGGHPTHERGNVGQIQAFIARRTQVKGSVEQRGGET